MKIIQDTLMVNGNFSQKRVQTFTCFWVATIYAFIPIVLPHFEVKEFVFLGWMGAGGWSLLRTQKPNENITQEQNG